MKYYHLRKYQGVFYYLKHGKRCYGYRYSYHDNQGNRHQIKRSGFKSIQDTLQNEIQVKTSHRQLLDSHQLTIKQWGKKVIESKKAGRITTYKAYKHLLEEDVFPYIGNLKLVQLTPLKYKYKCWVRLLQKGLSENTIKDVNAKVQAIYNLAVNDNIIKRNPIKKTDITQTAIANSRPRKQIMTKRQLNRFNRVLRHHSILIQVIFFILERTGMRAGELLGLHWKDIDFTKHTISINHTRDAYGERRPKTVNSQRTLTVDNSLVKLLKNYYQQMRKQFQVSSDDFVILGKHGNPLIPKVLSIKLKHLLVESNLKKLIGKFSCHTFRHMFASKLIVDYKVDPLTVSRILGHASPAITMKIYAQLSRRRSMNIGKILEVKSK